MITVITPAYNAAQYIEKCIQSVAEQAIEGLEHLILDAGSTDGTAAIVAEASLRYPHIRWVSEKDRGQSDAMNKGIAMATNPVISFLNVDDFYEPGAIPFAAEFFKTAPENTFLVGNCRVLKEDGTEYMINKPFPFDPVRFMLDYTFPYNPSAYFYHKSLHQKAGLYKVDDHLTMDIDFIFKMMPFASVAYKDRILGNYVMVANSKTMQEIASGRNVENLQHIFRENLPKLKWTQRLDFAIQKGLGKHRGWLMHYYRNPAKVFEKLLGKSA